MGQTLCVPSTPRAMLLGTELEDVLRRSHVIESDLVLDGRVLAGLEALHPVDQDCQKRLIAGPVEPRFLDRPVLKVDVAKRLTSIPVSRLIA